MEDANNWSFMEQREREYYEEGCASVPLRFDELKREAGRVLNDADFEFIAAGAGTGDTMLANREGFGRWRIVPRVLRGVSKRDLCVELFGQELSAPLLVAPIPLSLAREDGERHAIRAADSLGVPLVSNTTAAVTVEDLAEEAHETTPLFQLYWNTNWDVTASLVRRAEEAGFGAILVTVDAPVPRWKPQDLENAYAPLQRNDRRANYFTDPAFRETLDVPPEDDMDAAIQHFKETLIEPDLSWDDISFLRNHTSLPILLKGILHPDDVTKAIECGVDGIVVSNHGGRQIDGEIGAVEALPAVADAANGRVPVLFDSGLRTGADMFKAIALGADAVCIGRPVLYGLALAGQQGVRDVLLNVLAEFDSIAGLTGCTSVDDIDRSVLRDGAIPGTRDH